MDTKKHFMEDCVKCDNGNPVALMQTLIILYKINDFDQLPRNGTSKQKHTNTQLSIFNNLKKCSYQVQYALESIFRCLRH